MCLRKYSRGAADNGWSLSHINRSQLHLLSEVVLSPCVAGRLHSEVRHSHLRATPINLVDIINLFSEGGLGDASNALHMLLFNNFLWLMVRSDRMHTGEISLGQRLLLVAFFNICTYRVLTLDSSARKGYLLTILRGNLSSSIH